MANRTQEGKEYIAMQAPQELHMWIASHPWSAAIFNDAGVSLAGATMYGELIVNPERTKNTKRSPLLLDTGLEIDGGFVDKKQVLKVNLPVRVAGVRQFNDAMRELSLKFKIITWETKKLDVITSNKNALLKYARFSPDGTGVSLYMQRAYFNGEEREYTQMLYSVQNELVGSFRDDMVRCAIKKKVIYKPDCLIEKKQKSSQTILRKKDK